MVWIYHKHKLIAQHLRDPMVGRYSTIPEHLPSHYKAYLDRSPQYYIRRAEKISLNAQAVISRVFSTKKHPEQLYKSCEGILSLAGKYEKGDFNKACELALELDACYYIILPKI